MRWGVLQRRLQELRTVRAVSLLRSHGIEPIVIKGVAAARYYPEDRFRISIDVDLAVSSANYDAAQKIVSGTAGRGLAIDLHRELRHLDSVPWDDLVENSVELELSEGPVRVMRPEDDLRILAVHWLTDGGVYKERLLDIVFLIDATRQTFDWDASLNVVPEHRRRWVECALGIAAKYMGLDLTSTPVQGAADRLPGWLVRTVEREWSAIVKPRPLEASLDDPRLLFQQIKKRMRPSPLLATIDCDGSFDARTRIFYQFRNGVRRIAPSYRRVLPALKYKLDPGAAE